MVRGRDEGEACTDAGLYVAAFHRHKVNLSASGVAVTFIARIVLQGRHCVVLIISCGRTRVPNLTNKLVANSSNICTVSTK